MGKKYDEIEKSIAAAASTLPIAGAVVKVFGMLALEGLREYSRFVDTQEIHSHAIVCEMLGTREGFTRGLSFGRIKTLCEKLANDGTKP